MNFKKNYISVIRINCPPPYFAEGEKNFGVFSSKRLFFRPSVCLYHEVACGSSMLGDSLRRKGISEGLCRHGCGKRETMDHVFIDCNGYRDRRIKMTNACNKLGVDMITSIIMTDKRLQPLVEDWLMAIGLTKLKKRKK